jgi:hypothetical protein
MKRYVLGIAAVILAISFSAFTIAPKAVTNSRAGENWYPVSPTTQLTTSSTATYTSFTKAQVISAQSCNDTKTIVCFVGSTGSVPVGTAASSFSRPNQVTHQ